MTQQSDGDNLAAKIAALKAELEAEAAASAASGGAPAPHTPAELTRQADEAAVIPDTVTEKTFRVVVATDWSSAALPLAVLRAYATLFPPEAPVELVFAVPHEPTATDLSAVSVLFEGLDGVENTAALQLEAFDEATTKACYAAIIPTGDADALIMELSVFFTHLHHLAVLVRDPAKLSEEPAPTTGFNAGLSRRLAQFRTVPA